MRRPSSALRSIGRLALAATMLWPHARADAAPAPEDDDDDDEPARAANPSYEFAADAIDAEMLAVPEPAPAESLGATPGGSKDANLVRALIDQGIVPRPEQVAPEGLFSEHDLPLAAAAECEQLLCVHAEVTDAALATDPGLHHLAQLGFSSALEASQLQRPPLDLVFVVDLSGSMSGRPLSIVRDSMLAVLGQLSSEDRVAIVGFDERAHRRLAPTKALDPAVATAIASLEAGGTSHLDAGMWAGLVAARDFGHRAGTRTRIMLFTDDRPTYGRDQPAAFVDLARAAAADGIGITTVGVGVRFDAALAREVAAVRGGNLLFFDDLERMRRVFEADFDTMVTELAHDLELVVEPTAGMRVTEVYGLPASAVQRRGDGIALQVETLFASRRKGAIYFGLSPIGRADLPRVPARDGMRLGEVRLGYREVGSAPGEAARFSRAELITRRHATASPGLRRGSLLVDEALALREAGAFVHGHGEAARARQVVSRVRARFEASRDPELEPQAILLDRLLALLGD